ncbi:hypothetical protein DNC80_01945 [Flavobacterium sp. SOK18b]|uniref:hypothetical protein n=1 Tax=Flavobacterium sp. SOK18b TaxID=797900 RepID=UPI0015F94742|nr:hypothetical protein [Flavobacterium sp. SOK18b]MBB1192429.1 hypothetical protein [Flavobacterium sp. SOK18b]
MKLTTEQINQLYLFTRQHYIEYYDLQTELVDHLANAIETEWQQNPKLTFEEVLNKEFKKFGVFGFMDVVQSRQAALGKKYNSIVWEHFKEFFGIHKIVLTLAMTFLLFIILKVSTYQEWTIIGLYLSLFGFTLYEIIKSQRLRNKKKKSEQKRWLFEEIINQYGAFSGAILLPFNIILQIFNRIDSYVTNDYFLVAICFVLVLLSVTLFIIFKVIPSKTQTYLEQTYPEYKYEKL